MEKHLKAVEVVVTYKYILEIDQNNPIVKEYESENEMIVDCASYRFLNILPVLESRGVTVKDVEVLGYGG